jgi:hypothetical protein
MTTSTPTSAVTWPKWAKFELPGDVQDLHLHTAQGMDDLLAARFSLPADMLDDLTQALGFAKPLAEEYRPFPMAIPSDFPAWWTPYQSRPLMFLGGQVIKDNVVRELLVEPGATEDTLTVHLRAYQL